MTPERLSSSLGAADLVRLAEEARPALVGARVRYLAPRGAEGFVIACDRGGRLLVALEPGTARAHLEVPSPGGDGPHRARDRSRNAAPSHEMQLFLERARPRIEGARVAAIEPVPGDRVLRIDLRRERGDGPAGPDALFAAGGASDPDALFADAASDRDGNAATDARDGTSDVDPDDARGADAHAKAPSPGPARYALWLAFFGLRADAALERLSSPVEVFSLRGAGRPLLSTGVAGERPPLFPDVDADPATLAYSRAVAARFEAAEAARALQEQRQALARELQQRRKRCLGAIGKLRLAAAETSRADEAQRAGELLLASFRLLKRGQSEVTVPDYFVADAPPRTIALDPELPPSEQAERYFTRAKKARRGARVTAERLAAFEADLVRVAAAEALLAADAPLEDVAREAGISLERLGAPATAGRARQGARAAKGQDGPGGPRRFRSRDGLDILVGRSNAENDELTTRIARSEDLFFHVTGCPGAHVIVRAPRGKSVPLETLLDAATLAVHYSKARDRGRAEVGYTPRKYVRKPRGARPGLVTVERSETLVVAGQEERLRRVLASAGGAGGAPEGGEGGPGP